MNMTQPNWIEHIQTANTAFKARIDPAKLPTARTPGQAVITCMDPRVNLEAIGIPQFLDSGEGLSSVRIIRTLGAMADYRSLIVGIYLAGFREITLLMHTDCGCCLAYSKVDTIIANMESRLPDVSLDMFKAEVGEPFADNLRDYLQAFQNPYDAVKTEIERIHTLPFIPDDLVLHGLVYDLTSGNVDVVVNGYDRV